MPHDSKCGISGALAMVCVYDGPPYSVSVFSVGVSHRQRPNDALMKWPRESHQLVTKLRSSEMP